MYMKKIGLVIFFAITLIGFYSINIVQALSFANWSGYWFKVKVSETGKAGTIVTALNPDGGEVVINNEKITDVYLKLLYFEALGDPPYYEVGYCAYNSSVWFTERYRYGTTEPLTWPIIGGEPTRFLTLFNMKRLQSQAIKDEYWVPLEVKGTEVNQSVGDINNGSFKNIGGIFLEEIGDLVITQRGIGSVKFTGTFIKSTESESTVPEGCRISAP
jgi:hypothetical protein